MTYNEWFEAHGKKHQNIMKKLQALSDDEVIEYFRFENMVKREPHFCALYRDHKKCHETEELNCYLCACPHFRFDDNGLSFEENRVLYSRCEIEAKEGMRFVSEDAIHQDCSRCLIPHNEAYIRKHFSRDWFAIMRKVKLNQV